MRGVLRDRAWDRALAEERGAGMLTRVEREGFDDAVSARAWA
jgi:hypothetical protein